MNKLDIFKSVSEIVVSLGVGAVTGNLVKITTPANSHILKKVCMGVGGLVLSNMAADSAVEYANTRIDDSVEKYNEFIKNRKK